MRRTPNVFPESLPAARGIGWRVQPHLADGSRAGWTDIKKRQMSVPLDATIASRNIRAHELAHASWTPARSPTSICKRAGVSYEALQRAEDCRIGYGLIDSGVTDYVAGTLSDEDIATLEAEGKRLLVEHGPSVLTALAKRLSHQVVSMAMTEDKDRILGLAERVGGEPLRALVENVAEVAETTLFPHGRYRHECQVRRYRRGRGRRVAAVVPFRRAVQLAWILDQLYPPEGAPAPGRKPPTPKPGSPCGAASPSRSLRARPSHAWLGCAPFVAPPMRAPSCADSTASWWMGACSHEAPPHRGHGAHRRLRLDGVVPGGHPAVRGGRSGSDRGGLLGPR